MIYLSKYLKINVASKPHITRVYIGMSLSGGPSVSLSICKSTPLLNYDNLWTMTI